MPDISQRGVSSLLIVLGIVVLIVIAGGTYYINIPKDERDDEKAKPAPTSMIYSPSPAITSVKKTASSSAENISDWKTYKSDLMRTTDNWDSLVDTEKKASWNFKYPSEWSLPDGFTLYSDQVMQNKKAEFISLISLKTGQTCFDKVEGIGRNTDKFHSQESFKVNELQITRRVEKSLYVEPQGKSPLWLYFYCAKKDDKAFYLFFYGDEKGTEKALFDQIVSTFKLD